MESLGKQFLFFVAHLPSDFRKTVQDLFRKAPVDKQVMMFSATLSEETHALCKRFMRLVSILLKRLANHL